MIYKKVFKKSQKVFKRSIDKKPKIVVRLGYKRKRKAVENMEKELKNYFARFHRVEKALVSAVNTGKGIFKHSGYDYEVIYENYDFTLYKESWHKSSDGKEFRDDEKYFSCSTVSELYKEIVDIIY